MSMTAGKLTFLFCCYFSICVCAYPHLSMWSFYIRPSVVTRVIMTRSIAKAKQGSFNMYLCLCMLSCILMYSSVFVVCVH